MSCLMVLGSTTVQSLQAGNSHLSRASAARYLRQHLRDLLMEELHHSRYVQEAILLCLKSTLGLMHCCFSPLLELLQA